MTILITGGAGFIGSHLAERLLAKTDRSLVLLDNFNDYYDPQRKHANVIAIAKNPRATIVAGDFCDEALVERLFAEHVFRHVVHLGGYPGVPASLERPRLYIDTNVGGTLTLLEAMRRHPVERFLFASSSTVYGRGAAAPFTEDGPLGVPLSPYGASKRAAELLGFTYRGLYDVPFVSLRFFNVYGPRLRPELALAAFTSAILEGRPLTLFGNGSVLRDFTHIDDICAGMIAALDAPGIAGESLNLGHDHPIEIRYLIELIEKAAGKPARIDRRPARAGDMPLTHADLTKSRRLLGYQPRVTIEAGVREYVDWRMGKRRS
jgi:UDP-glucuronate 4-epimerase